MEAGRVEAMRVELAGRVERCGRGWPQHLRQDAAVARALGVAAAEFATRVRVWWSRCPQSGMFVQTAAPFRGDEIEAAVAARLRQMAGVAGLFGMVFSWAVWWALGQLARLVVEFLLERTEVVLERDLHHVGGHLGAVQEELDTALAVAAGAAGQGRGWQ